MTSQSIFIDINIIYMFSFLFIYYSSEVPPYFTAGSACSACPAGYTECDDGLCTDVINADDVITPFVTSCDELENSDNGSGNGDGGDSGSGNESGSGESGSGDNESGNGEENGSGNDNENGSGDENGDNSGSGDESEDGSGNESESQNGDSAAGTLKASLLFLHVTVVLKMISV